MSYFTKGGGVARLLPYSTGYVIGSQREGPSSLMNLTGNLAFAGFAPGYKDGTQGVIVVVQDATGGRTINWGSYLTFNGTSTLNAAAGSKTVIDVVKTGGSWIGTIRGAAASSGGGSGTGLPLGGTTGQLIRKNSSTDGDASWYTLTKSDLDLSAVDNTSDTNKPVSTAQAAAIALKANSADPTFTGKVTTPTSTTVQAGFRLLPGFQPNTVADGDMWITNDGLRVRVNGATQLLGAKSHVAVQDFQMAASNMVDPLEAATRLAYARVTRAGRVLEVRASLADVSTGGQVQIDVKKNGVSVFSTYLTIDVGEPSSNTAALAPVLVGGHFDLAVDDEVSVDVLQPGTNAIGLIVSFIYEQNLNPVTGTDKQVLFNDAGSMGAATFTWDKTTNTLTIPNLAITGTTTGINYLANPMTTAGDLIVGGSSGTPVRLAAGTNGYFLTVSSGTPAWAQITKSTFGLANVDNTADVSKNVLSATKWTTARTLTLTGAVTGSASVDGSANVSLTTTLPNSGVPAGTYQSVTVNAKGIVIDGINPTTLEGYGITNGLSNPMTAVGDLIVGGTVAGGTAQTSVLPIGSNGMILRVQSGTPQWFTAPYLTSPMTTAGDLIVGGTSGVAQRLAIGAAGTILSSTGTAASWLSVLPISAGGTGGATAAAARTALGVAPADGGTLNNTTFTGTTSGISKSDIGLGAVNNTPDVAKEVLSATKWKTARAIAISGAVAGSVSSVDGTADVTINVVRKPKTVSTKTADYTLALSDAQTFIKMNSASANVLTVPLNSAVAFELLTEIELMQIGSGTTTVVGDSTVIVHTAGGYSTGQYARQRLIKIDTDEWVLSN